MPLGDGMVPVEAYLNPWLSEHEWMGAMRTDPRVRDRSWAGIRASVHGRYRTVRQARRFRFEERVEAPYNHRRPKQVGRPWRPY